MILYQKHISFLYNLQQNSAYETNSNFLHYSVMFLFAFSM